MFKVLSLLFYAWGERIAQPSGQQSGVRTVVLGAILSGIWNAKKWISCVGVCVGDEEVLRVAIRG